MAGVDIMTVKELLGHKTLAMTLRYSHLSPAHKTRAVNVLDRTQKTFQDEALKKVVSISR
jgi:site-specific recombinase XerD